MSVSRVWLTQRVPVSQNSLNCCKQLYDFLTLWQRVYITVKECFTEALALVKSDMQTESLCYIEKSIMWKMHISNSSQLVFHWLGACELLIWEQNQPPKKPPQESRTFHCNETNVVWCLFSITTDVTRLFSHAVVWCVLLCYSGRMKFDYMQEKIRLVLFKMSPLAAM